LEIIPLDISIAREIADIPRNIVPYMPDRIIAATAQYHELPLITVMLIFLS
jgi:predicted nucleic acid-binding protein